MVVYVGINWVNHCKCQQQAIFKAFVGSSTMVMNNIETDTSALGLCLPSYLHSELYFDGCIEHKNNQE